MNKVTMGRLGLAALAGVAPLLLGQVPAQPLSEYICIYTDGNCATASANCWAPGHQWGGSSCAHCNGTNWGSYCSKAENVNCPWSGTNSPCGLKLISGTCTAVGGAHVGICVGGYYADPPDQCTVPDCAIGGGGGINGNDS
jgi:hypothetical protein